MPLLGWEQWQFQVFFCKIIPSPSGAENFEKISVHEPMSLLYILDGRKNFIALREKAEFFCQKIRFFAILTRESVSRGNFFSSKFFLQVPNNVS